MKRLCLQIQPQRSLALDVESALARLQSSATAEITRGDDNGPYINLLFADVDVAQLWSRLRLNLEADPELAAATIVTCEGERSWHDYRLLHHFDPAEPLDEVEPR